METMHGDDIDPAFIDYGDIIRPGVTIRNDVMIPHLYK